MNMPTQAVTGKRLKKLLDDRRLVVVASSSRPTCAPRVVVVDEVDPWPDHQRPALTTR